MLTCLNYDQNMKLLETRQKSSLCMYKPNEIIFKVFKIIIIFQFKNFNSKLKKKIYTQTTDLSTPGKKNKQKTKQNKKISNKRDPEEPVFTALPCTTLSGFILKVLYFTACFSCKTKGPLYLLLKSFIQCKTRTVCKILPLSVFK